MDSFSILKIKYSNFQAPTIKLKVDGTELIHGTTCAIDHFELELSTDYEATGCSFCIYNEYQEDQTDFDRSGALKSLQLGASVEVELGYIYTSSVFVGLVTQVNYVFDADDLAPYIQVDCMDAKCLLMKTQRLDVLGEVKLNQVVSTMLSEQPVSSYLTGTSVDSITSTAIPLTNSMLSDYDFIIAQAQYFGFEFFVLQGKAYFREPPSYGTPTIALSSDEGILAARVSMKSETLVNKVTVNGIDATGTAAVTGSAQSSGTFSVGNTASKLLGKSEMVFYDPYSVDQNTATARAKAVMSQMIDGFGSIRCTCIGLPEIVPGSYISISGLMKEATGMFYVTYVRHSLTESEGYQTIFEARFRSL